MASEDAIIYFPWAQKTQLFFCGYNAHNEDDAIRSVSISNEIIVTATVTSEDYNALYKYKYQ